MEIGAKGEVYHAAERKHILCTVSRLWSFQRVRERVALCWFRLHKRGPNPLKESTSVHRRGTLKRKPPCQAWPLSCPVHATNQAPQAIKGHKVGNVHGGLHRGIVQGNEEEWVVMGGWWDRVYHQQSAPFQPQPRMGHNPALRVSPLPCVETLPHYWGMSIQGTSVTPAPQKIGLPLTANEWVDNEVTCGVGTWRP